MTEPLSDDQVWGCDAMARVCGGCAYFVPSDVQPAVGYCTAVETGPYEATTAADPACDCYEPTPGQMNPQGRSGHESD